LPFEANPPDAGQRAAGAPLLSVLMASRNAARFIGRSIESVLAIEGVDLELVIQDALSDDGTTDIAAGFDDPRIRLVSEADTGQSDGWNRALKRARGEWIGWLNADDLYVADGVARLAAALDDSVDFVYGDYRTIDAQGRGLKAYQSSRPFGVAEVLRYGVYINCSAAVYRAALLRELDGLDPALHYCMDYDLLLRLARRGAPSRYVPTRVQELRTHDDAKTSRHVWRFFREAATVGFRNAHAVKHGSVKVLMGQTIFFAYIATRPIWQTQAWRRVRPAKRL
jgi:glycosyltransferase involved in cell wall biosynthesis